jgi:UTP:GlnB (protein PII) uridylyltransferase
MPERGRPGHHGADRTARSPPADWQRQAVCHLPEAPAWQPRSAGLFRSQATRAAGTLPALQRNPYSLEPNCKESPGGLRDLQVIFWVAKVAGYGASWAELQESGIITRKAGDSPRPAKDYLIHLRIRLHFIGRREDRLLFDYQNNLAENFGFVTNEAKRASEQLMQVYYRHAKTVTVLNIIMLQNIAPR